MVNETWESEQCALHQKFAELWTRLCHIYKYRIYQFFQLFYHKLMEINQLLYIKCVLVFAKALHCQICIFLASNRVYKLRLKHLRLRIEHILNVNTRKLILKFRQQNRDSEVNWSLSVLVDFHKVQHFTVVHFASLQAVYSEVDVFEGAFQTVYLSQLRSVKVRLNAHKCLEYVLR